MNSSCLDASNCVFPVPVWTHRPGTFLLRYQVIPASRNQVAPPMLLCVMQGETVPRQTHQLGSYSHLQTDEVGSRWPAALLRHLLTQLTIPPEGHSKGGEGLTDWLLDGGALLGSDLTYPGCPGRCCLLLGSRLTISFSFSTASLLGERPAISSSAGGPGSNIATPQTQSHLGYLSHFLQIITLAL